MTFAAQVTWLKLKLGLGATSSLRVPAQHVRLGSAGPGTSPRAGSLSVDSIIHEFLTGPAAASFVAKVGLLYID